MTTKPKIHCLAMMAGDNPNMGDSMPYGSRHWRVRLWYYSDGRRKQITVPFSTGPLAGEPDADSVMECLVSDAWTYEHGPDEMSGLGYSFSDGMRVWQALERQVPKFQRFYPDWENWNA